jgi:hypothetical protein
MLKFYDRIIIIKFPFSCKYLCPWLVKYIRIKVNETKINLSSVSEYVSSNINNDKRSHADLKYDLEQRLYEHDKRIDELFRRLYSVIDTTIHTPIRYIKTINIKLTRASRIFLFFLLFFFCFLSGRGFYLP